MASSKGYLEYILEQLRLTDGISFRPMMREYLLYRDGVLFGGVYDDRLLVKISKGNGKYGMRESVPYEGAKPMYLVDAVDEPEVLRDIVLDTCASLKR